MHAAATDERDADNTRRQKILRLDALAGDSRRRLRVAGLCNVMAGWLLIAQAAAIAWSIQQVLVEKASPQTVMIPLGALLLVGLLRALLAWVSRSQADAGVVAITLALRQTIARRLFSRGPLWLRGQRSGALAERMGTHAEAMEGYFGGYWLARTEVLAVPLAILIAVFCVDRVVGTVLLVTLPLIPVFMMLVGWGAEAASRRQLQALARMGGHFADRLRGLGVIRLYGRGDAELESLHDAAESVRERSLKVLRIAFLSSAALEFFASLSVAMVAVYLGLSYLGMIDLRSSPLTLGMGVFCLLLAPEYYAPLRRLATHYHDRASALAALDEIEAVFMETGDDASAAPDGTASRSKPAPADTPRADSIYARDLCLRPLGAHREALSHLSFTLGTGEHLALAGPSGCGKSTLLDALAGWLPAEAGSLSVPRALRIGYATQRPFLFQGSIADNLRMARPNASTIELRAAAEAAQVMRFADKLPLGLDTQIGERGFGLSGGEARRIALARVFLRDPQLLLLDEPTAFLDADTEAALLAALTTFARGRTLVMATHSVAAMRMAGQVLWLPEGTIGTAEGAR
ncbi:MAG: thiol reductant ABC exporter subunit CydD [Pseudoxanthomonas sp.]